MKFSWLVTICVVELLVFKSVQSRSKPKELKCFPSEFQFGVSTAAYQIEGAWNVSGKSYSIWDYYTHMHPERIFDGRNGDVACDSYHQYREDVRMLVKLKVSFYRFSISWPRILPNGFINEVNEQGVLYYKKLINELLANNITPFITIYHWDLPQSLQELGGWTNPLMADYYRDYAMAVFELFGEDVKYWVTFNEPFSFCQEGYGGNDAPGAQDSGIQDYLCGHNVLRAHGKAYALYNEKYKARFGGNVGITLDMPWIEPATSYADDNLAAEVARQFMFGWFANPIFGTGDYPSIMRRRIDDISHFQKYPRSRLPKFTASEIELIKGSADFLGLNHYTTILARKTTESIQLDPSFYTDMGVEFSQKVEWPRTNSTWLRVVPWGLRKTLNWIKVTYNNPLVLITENGVSYEPGLNDQKRISYIYKYLLSLYDAVFQDGCLVVGYAYWTLMDNFEWTRGYSERFGLYEVNYNSHIKARYVRRSADYYGNVSQSGCIQEPWNFT